MSHITVGKGGQNAVIITDLNAVRAAARELGLKVLQQKSYRWFGQSVGDSPLPAGWKKGEIGENAAYVLRLNDDKTLEAQREHGPATEPYDLALIEAPGGGYYLACDTWCGGLGLCDVVGEPIDQGKGDIVLAPKFIQEYRIAAAMLAAREQGHDVEVHREENGDAVLVATVAA